MFLNDLQRRLRDFADDPDLAMPVSVAVGAAKGAIVGLAIGKLALATAAGVAGGAVVGVALSWRARQRAEPDRDDERTHAEIESR